MALNQHSLLGMAMRFRVVVDEISDLGSWASCTGLAVDFRATRVREGANYDASPLLPDRVEYRPVTLRRAVSRAESAAVQSWLTRVVADWYGGTSASRYSARTARISLLDARGGPVASWVLRNVYPSSWSGPDLDAAGGQVAVETLQLQHEGFL